MLEYRSASFDDVEEIHKLLNGYARQGLMLPRARNAIYENLRDYIVACDEDGNLVGCGALHFVWDRLAEVRSLAVQEGLKKTGVGSMLVSLLEAEGIRRGAKFFFTLTYQPGFFAKCGYLHIPKEDLPQKVWKECVYCPMYPDCDELALFKKTPDFKDDSVIYE